MRRRLDRWWHRRIRHHALGPQELLVTIPSPWPEFPEFLVGDIWVTKCLEDDCYWASIEYSPRRKAVVV